MTRILILTRKIGKLKITVIAWYKFSHLIYVWTRVLTLAHCSYLDVYISQNIRLCNGDFEGWFQTSLQSSIMIIFIWNIMFILPIFLLFFVKSTAFCTLLLLCQKGWYIWVTFFHQIATQTCQLIGIAATVCKKQWIWQLLQKIEGKWIQ